MVVYLLVQRLKGVQKDGLIFVFFSDLQVLLPFSVSLRLPTARGQGYFEGGKTRDLD